MDDFVVLSLSKQCLMFACFVIDVAGSNCQFIVPITQQTNQD